MQIRFVQVRGETDAAERKNQRTMDLMSGVLIPDMMAGVLLLFVLIMCVTLFQAAEKL